MAEDNHPTKYGTWVFGAEGKNKFYVPVMGRNEAGEMFPQTTWQVRRSVFDKMLFDTADDLGVETLCGTAVGVLREGDTVTGVKVRTDDGEVELTADMVVDASGQNTFLSREGVAGEREPGHYGRQIGIFGHFKNSVRGVEGDDEKKVDDTIIFYREKNHWAWYIPIDDEIVSIGVVVPTDFYKEKGETKEEFLLREMMLINPELSWRLENAELVNEVRGMSNYSYQIQDFCGKGYVCVGDAHRFIDPIFSLGMHFALHEGRYAAKLIERCFADPERAPEMMKEHEKYCEDGMDVIQLMLDCFWEYPVAFALYINSNKYRDRFVDIFAGRVYSDNAQKSDAIMALKKLSEQGEAWKASQAEQEARVAV
jgi:flavin-dependent dehydrogenase